VSAHVGVAPAELAVPEGRRLWRGSGCCRPFGPALLGLAALLVAKSGAAHEPFQITTDARALRDGLTLHVTMAGRTATLACPDAVGAARNLRADDLTERRAPLEACARGLYTVTGASGTLEPRTVVVSLTEEGDFDARLRYAAAPPGPLALEAMYLARLPDSMFGAELTVTGDRAFLGQALLRAAAPRFTTRVPAFGDVPGETAPHVPSFGEYVRLGVEHILTSYDHLAFLLGLLAVCRKLSSVLAIVTAFTLAHSLTLAVAALGLVTLPSRLVEPLIAATIVAVAFENLWRGEAVRYRWVVAFAFGLIHGFGFAGALIAVGLGRDGAPLALPLCAFNLGVELGQVGVVAVILPLLLRLRRTPLFERYGARVLSVAVGLAGLLWLGQRLFADG